MNKEITNEISELKDRLEKLSILVNKLYKDSSLSIRLKYSYGWLCGAEKAIKCEQSFDLSKSLLSFDKFIENNIKKNL